MSSLDISIVATALPTISNQFHSKDEYTWVITSYMLAKTAFQPSKIHSEIKNYYYNYYYYYYYYY